MNWIAVEQGKTQLRAWAMQGNNVLDHFARDLDTPTSQDLDERTLLSLIGDWLDQDPTLVLVCGQTGAQPRPVPATPRDLQPVLLPTTDPRLKVYGLPGLRQSTPPDLMHSDTARIAGFLALNKEWDGVICQPGAQTSWAQVSAGEVVSFQTFLTGDLAKMLTQRLSLADMKHRPEWDGDAFAGALDAAQARPERMASALNTLRVEYEMQNLSAKAALARLWGILVGAELAAARPYWLGQQLAVIASPSTTKPYQQALELQGVPVTIANADRMTLAGLTAARLRIDQTT